MIYGPNANPLSDVDVQLHHAAKYENTVTYSTGQYSFTTSGVGSVTLAASKNESAGISKGVDVLDLVEIRKNILSMNPNPLNSPFKVVAADANRDGSIDVADLVSIRKLILSMQSHFSTDDNDQPESLWRFVGADFANVSAEDALGQVASHETITSETLGGKIITADFIGIKLRDANLDWAQNIN